MDRQDDPEIAGDIVFYRRIPPWAGRVEWKEGAVNFTSANFKDAEQELSIHRASETTPEQVLAGHETFGLIQITAKQIRDACPGIKICRSVEEPENGHTLVCGKVTAGMAAKLKKAATWVENRLPTPDTPYTGDTDPGATV
jgi:hypothetical protein